MQTGDAKSSIYRGFTTPCTCLALSPDGRTLYAGAWEKTVLAWDVASRAVVATFSWHNDFVKCLLFVPTPARGSRGWLLSGSGDATIVVWDAQAGAKLAVLRGHTRAVGVLALDPLLSDDDAAVVCSAGSGPAIRRWRIPYADPAGAVEEWDGEGIVEHETSVHALRPLGDDGDFWTASADGTARRVDLRSPPPPVRGGGSRADTVLQHGDYVNDVAMSRDGRWLATACRDEEVRLWDVASGELVHTFSGHADEVTALAVVAEGEWLVSASIDCTVRRWPLKPADVAAARAAREAAVAAVDTVGGEDKGDAKVDAKAVLTAEEEAELAELMDSD